MALAAGTNSIDFRQRFACRCRIEMLTIRIFQFVHFRGNPNIQTTALDVLYHIYIVASNDSNNYLLLNFKHSFCSHSMLLSHFKCQCHCERWNDAFNVILLQHQYRKWSHSFDFCVFRAFRIPSLDSGLCVLF